MADQMVGKSVTRTRKHQRRSTIRILEEAVHLLRLAPGHLLAYYYIGSLPFILGLLYFWGDMSRNVFAADYCAIASLGMALLFVWMKSWQAVFAIRIRATIDSQPARSFPSRRILPLIANQTLLHASGLLVLPLAALMMIPFGWCFAFYQNATVLEHRQSQDLFTLYQRSWHQAKLWPKQNHILLIVFFFFGLIVFFNLAITLFMLPYLLRTFFGFESIFTLSGINSLNTTFLATAIGITYLCMDPIVKTAYMLRCYYGEALKSGADIRNQLNKLAQKAKTIASLAVLALVISPAAVIAIEQPAIISGSPRSTANTFAVEDLDRSIEQVLIQREFSWRLPRQRMAKDNQKKSGPIAATFEWAWRMLGKGVKTLWGWVEKLFEWLADLLPKSDPGKKSSETGWQNSMRVLLIVLLVLAGVVLICIFWRIWQRRRITPIPVESKAVSIAPDLTDDGLKADQLPANRWLVIAKELLEKGSVRLAMRALYLATLAHLAEHDMINIAAYKSNLDYKRELQRRAHGNHDLLTAFSTVVNLLERVWYGMHNISQPEVDKFMRTQKRIMTFVEE
ncbi:MAG: hypothetical protein JSU83_15135 [Deltaproteobacteria bacterium]|nr:MAG: hypothetical protein JSU83_15135 [Deltaproteobacteria bacterium]